jgi:hypothetical protein
VFGQETNNRSAESCGITNRPAMGAAMFQLLHIFTVILVAIAMALSLAHVLELPGKLRLDRDTYLKVQTILAASANHWLRSLC